MIIIEIFGALIVVGIIVSILKFVLGLALGLTAGLISFTISFFRLAFCNPILTLLFAASLYFFDSGFALFVCFALYAILTAGLVQDEGRKEVEETLQKMIETDGIVLKKYADSVKLAENPYKIFHKFFYDNEAAIKYLAKEVEAGNISVNFLADGLQYYYSEKKLNEFIQSIQKTALDELEEWLQKYGLVCEQTSQKIVNSLARSSFHADLAQSYGQEYFSHIVKYFLENGRIKKAGGELYIEPKIIATKWQQVRETLRIDKQTFANLFGEHNLEVQRNIMRFILKNEPKFEYVYDEKSALWLEVNYKKSHTCPRCNKFSDKLEAYGNKTYCASCLKQIHDEEEKKLNSGEHVKRYVSAPPKGIKIKRIE